MKKITLIYLMLMGISTLSQAQNDAISKWFSKYENNRDFTVVSISGRMFSVLTDIKTDNPEDQEILKTISNLTGLKILSNENVQDGYAMYDECLKILSSKNYETVMTLRESDHDTKFVIREEAGKINEVIMISGGKHQFTMLSLTGIINLEQLSKISKKLEIDGLDELDQLDKNNKHK